VSSRAGHYRKVRGLRVRPVPEVGACYVYTPTHPRLYALNMTAWLILELCEGRSPRALAQAYRDEMQRAYWQRVGFGYFSAPEPPSRAGLGKELRDGVRMLRTQGIIKLITQGAQHAKKI